MIVCVPNRLMIFCSRPLQRDRSRRAVHISQSLSAPAISARAVIAQRKNGSSTPVSELVRFWSFRSLQESGRGWLPKCLALYIKRRSWGHVAEWLRNGLQNRVHQFNSGRGLHSIPLNNHRFAKASVCSRVSFATQSVFDGLKSPL